jgi:hypothetical protein
MEQRRVRLGDIVDDYCTRERRVTNHAVVAMAGEQIQLTRCTTCDAEHPYKAAKVPHRRKKAETNAPHEQALAGRERDMVADDDLADGQSEQPLSEPMPKEGILPAVYAPLVAMSEREGTPATAAEEETHDAVQEDGAVRRPLIRATLPRPEGQLTVRQPPEFTIRQSIGRGGHRGARPANNGGPSGQPGVGAHRRGQRSKAGHGRSGSAFEGHQDRDTGRARHGRSSRPRSGKKRSR